MPRAERGAIISAEYSATPRAVLGRQSFPAVDDSASNVPGNPNYYWTRTSTQPPSTPAGRLGNLIGAYTEPDPTLNANGVWGNRVVLQGHRTQRRRSDLEFRSAFGFPSHGLQRRLANY